MAHPLRYEEDDPVLARVRSLALALPGAAEKVPHGRPAFYTVKVFGYYGGSIKVAGTYVTHDQSLLFVPDPGEYEALAQDSRVYRPAYVGPFGWLGLDLTIDMDWTEVAELLDTSYRITAPKRLIAEFDARR
jgi:predicted DNA-binding protein (MmcQ/YjbR family)